RLLWTALRSDLFAARSPTGQPSSPYWRPTTVLWYIANHRLFGLDHPGPWHVGNVVLNALVTLLAYLVMRRLGIGPVLASAGACVLAVHPSRVETVAWISGVPDILAAACMLGSLLVVIGIVDRNGSASDKPSGHRWPAWALWCCALLLDALALGSKEI